MKLGKGKTSRQEKKPRRDTTAPPGAANPGGHAAVSARRGPRKNTPAGKTHRLKVGLSDAEMARVRTAAVTARRTMSGLVCDLLVAAAGGATPATGGTSLGDLASLRAELRAIGVNVNQSARALNILAQRGFADHSACSAEVDRVRARLGTLGQLLDRLLGPGQSIPGQSIPGQSIPGQAIGSADAADQTEGDR